MVISVPFELGDPVYVIRHNGVSNEIFRYGLLDEVPLDRIYKNKISAEFKWRRLQMMDRRDESEQSREA